MAIVRSDLPPNAKYLGLYLNTFMNDRQDAAWPSIATIVGETGLARATVIKYLNVMEEAGWISRQKRFGKSTVYVAHVPSSSTAELVRELNHSSSGGELTVVQQTDPNSPLNSPLNSPKGASRFSPPSIQEVAAYCRERGNQVDAQAFIDHYEANGWMRGKTKIKNWKACVRTWEKRHEEGKRHRGNGAADRNADLHDYLDAKISGTT